MARKNQKQTTIPLDAPPRRSDQPTRIQDEIKKAVAELLLKIATTDDPVINQMEKDDAGNA